MRPSPVSSTLFVQLYMKSVQQGHTLSQFAARVGMKYGAAAVRISWYRKKGVKLPKLRSKRGPQPRRINVSELNQIVLQSLQSA